MANIFDESNLSKKVMSRAQIARIMKSLEQDIKALEGEKDQRNEPTISRLRESHGKWKIILEYSYTVINENSQN